MKRRSSISKKRTALCLLLLVLLAALALLLAIPKLKEQHEAETHLLSVDPVKTLRTEAEDTVVFARVTSSTGDCYELQREDGHLKLVSSSGLMTIDSNRERELLQVLTQFTVQATVTDDVNEVEDHLSDMGLQPPLANADVRYSDGREISFSVGVSVPNTTYAYWMWSEDQGVYMCDSGIADVMAYEARQLLPISQLCIEPSLVDRLVLQDENEESAYSFSDGKSGKLTSPFVYPLSSDATSDLLSALSNFRLGTFLGEVTPENESLYGFDYPLRVMEIHQKAGRVNTVDENGSLVTMECPETEITLTIGREEGDFFYTCSYEGNGYLVSRFLAQAMVTVNYKDTLSKTPVLMGDAEITEVEFVCDTGSMHALAETNEEETTVTLNEAPWTQTEWELWLDRISLLTAAGNAPDGAKPAGNARWSLKLTAENGETRFIEAYPMDAFSDLLSVDGVICHYIHSDAADEWFLN